MSKRTPTLSPAHVALGRALRGVREDQGLSQERLGQVSDLDRTYVGGVERGERNPTLDTLLKLSAALDTTPGELLARAEGERSFRNPYR